MTWLQHLCALLREYVSRGPDEAEHRGRSYEPHAAEHDRLTGPTRRELSCGGSRLERFVDDVPCWKGIPTISHRRIRRAG